jgi:hypothetical protein
MEWNDSIFQPREGHLLGWRDQVRWKIEGWLNGLWGCAYQGSREEIRDAWDIPEEHRTEVQKAVVRSNERFVTNPPQDGRRWECQCARCGSSVEWNHCGACGGEGITGPGELYEEDPLWYDMDDYAPCAHCNGDASWGICLSSPEWCEANPIPGREDVQRGTVEWFPVSPAPNS